MVAIPPVVVGTSSKNIPVLMLDNDVTSVLEKEGEEERPALK